MQKLTLLAVIAPFAAMVLLAAVVFIREPADFVMRPVGEETRRIPTFKGYCGLNARRPAERRMVEAMSELMAGIGQLIWAAVKCDDLHAFQPGQQQQVKLRRGLLWVAGIDPSTGTLLRAADDLDRTAFFNAFAEELVLEDDESALVDEMLSDRLADLGPPFQKTSYDLAEAVEIFKMTENGIYFSRQMDMRFGDRTAKAVSLTATTLLKGYIVTITAVVDDADDRQDEAQTYRILEQMIERAVELND